MNSRWHGVVADRRIDLLDCIPHPEVRTGVRRVHELRDDRPRAKTPNLVGSDVDQPKYAMPWFLYAPERTRSEQHGASGGANPGPLPQRLARAWPRPRVAALEAARPRNTSDTSAVTGEATPRTL